MRQTVHHRQIPPHMLDRLIASSCFCTKHICLNYMNSGVCGKQSIICGLCELRRWPMIWLSGHGDGSGCYGRGGAKDDTIETQMFYDLGYEGE